MSGITEAIAEANDGFDRVERKRSGRSDSELCQTDFRFCVEPGYVGLKAVQEVQTAIAHYRAQDAIVGTNSDFTEQAYNLAKSNRVRLINREELIEMVLAMKNKQQSLDKSKQHAV